MTKPIGSTARACHITAAERCRADPGQWVSVTMYRSLYVAKSMCGTIQGKSNGNDKITAYQPKGAFDAYYEMREDGWEVFAKYISGEETCASTDSPADTGASDSTTTPEAGTSSCGDGSSQPSRDRV